MVEEARGITCLAAVASIGPQLCEVAAMPDVLTTTIVGSLPKPRWLAGPEQLWAPWVVEGEALAEAKRDAVRVWLRDQEDAGIDVVTDGEQTRRHFVTKFIEGLDGVDFERGATVKIRQHYDASVPRVVGPVSRSHPCTSTTPGSPSPRHSGP